MNGDGAPSRAKPGKTARLSVVMPVHNALPYLDAAIESILAQSEPDFEFVILDDASTDGSTLRLREWAEKEPRIRLIESKRKLGPALSSQKVAAAARCPFVARMDADDISYPDRLRDQLAVFDDHPEAGVVASLCDFIDTDGRKLREPEAWRLGRHSAFVPFAHGAMIYRRELFDQVGGYREECVYWEDQDLVTRMAAQAPVMVILRALYQVRLSTTSTRVSSEQSQLEHSVDLMYRSVGRLQRGQGYDDLLPGFVDDGSKVDPRVFISLGSQLLWAGGKPRNFRRMLRRAKLGFNFRTLTGLVWSAWAFASPSTLRLFLRLLVFARNSLADAAGPTGVAVCWDPFGDGHALANRAETRSAPLSDGSGPAA